MDSFTLVAFINVTVRNIFMHSINSICKTCLIITEEAVDLKMEPLWVMINDLSTGGCGNKDFCTSLFHFKKEKQFIYLWIFSSLSFCCCIKTSILWDNIKLLLVKRKEKSAFSLCFQVEEATQPEGERRPPSPQRPSPAPSKTTQSVPRPEDPFSLLYRPLQVE